MNALFLALKDNVWPTLSKFVPITYGMELLKGAVAYGYSLSDLLYPLIVLCFMSVVDRKLST
ncbi:MAG TPA: hypothetical protein VEY68_00185 [Anoxybacillus sp.]|nr:hypothetical protein [Anoxybacillus sp.]